MSLKVQGAFHFKAESWYSDTSSDVTNDLKKYRVYCVHTPSDLWHMMKWIWVV